MLYTKGIELSPGPIASSVANIFIVDESRAAIGTRPSSAAAFNFCPALSLDDVREAPCSGLGPTNTGRQVAPLQMQSSHPECGKTDW
jgi:hypothetical protein